MSFVHIPIDNSSSSSTSKAVNELQTAIDEVVSDLVAETERATDAEASLLSTINNAVGTMYSGRINHNPQSQALTFGSYNNVTFASYSSNNITTASTSGFTAPVTGRYWFSVNMPYTCTSTNGHLNFAAFVNGTITDFLLRSLQTGDPVSASVYPDTTYISVFAGGIGENFNPSAPWSISGSTMTAITSGMDGVMWKNSWGLNDWIQCDCGTKPAGVYSVNVPMLCATDRPIVTLSESNTGTTIGTFDLYALSLITTSRTWSFVWPSAGNMKLRMSAISKNPSSSGYLMQLMNQVTLTLESTMNTNFVLTGNYLLSLTAGDVVTFKASPDTASKTVQWGQTYYASGAQSMIASCDVNLV